MELIWHGTASIEVITSSGQVMFDPFVPIAGSKVNVKIEEYDGVTDIFVTHGHFDHIYSIPDIVRRNPEVKVYCTNTPYHTLLKKGVPTKNLIKIKYGEVLSVNDLSIKVIHGRHAVLPKASLPLLMSFIKSPHRRNIFLVGKEHRICRENDETVFYQIDCEGKSVSLMGSMNLRDDIEYPKNADIMILPYNGWDDNYPPAIKIVEQLKPKRVLLDHYDDTFPPITKAIDLTPFLNKYDELSAPMELGKRVTV